MQEASFFSPREIMVVDNDVYESKFHVRSMVNRSVQGGAQQCGLFSLVPTSTFGNNG
jgi:hypothetical protein